MTTPPAADIEAIRKPTLHNFRWHHGPRRWKRELQLCRFYFERGKAGHGGSDNGISIKVIWEPRDLWIGLYWDAARDHFKLYLCVLPCLPIRIHFKRIWGGFYR